MYARVSVVSTLSTPMAIELPVVRQCPKDSGRRAAGWQEVVPLKILTLIMGMMISCSRKIRGGVADFCYPASLWG